MKVLILAAGYGTRLYPLVKDTPKALLKINNKPLINYILDRIVNLSIILCCCCITHRTLTFIFGITHH